MLILRNFIIVILLLLLAAVAVVGLMVEAPPVLNWTPDRINALGRSVLEVMRPGYLLFIIWGSVILGLLLVFLITVARPRRRMKIEVQMGGGRVVIMDAAIKKYIRNALAELGEVTVKKIDLREHRNLVTTNITADVRTRENLPTLERRIISRVRAALAEDLGITNLGDVHVFIRNFEVTGRPIKPAPAEKREIPKKSLESDRDEEPAVVDEAEKRPGGTAPTAATGAAAGVTGAAGGEHVLADPVEPPGAGEPIIIDDTTEPTAPAELSPSDSASEQPPAGDIAVTESSAAVPIDEKRDDTSADTTFASAPAEPEPGAGPPDDMDHHPAPWEETKKAGDDERDPEDRGPLPL